MTSVALEVGRETAFDAFKGKNGKSEKLRYLPVINANQETPLSDDKVKVEA